jgi:hypothetical protein
MNVMKCLNQGCTGSIIAFGTVCIKEMNIKRESQVSSTFTKEAGHLQAKLLFLAFTFGLSLQENTLCLF